MKQVYSPGERQKYIQLNLLTRYEREGPLDKGKEGWSYRRIADDIALHFDVSPPSPATIQNDLNLLSEKLELRKKKAASEVLNPEFFREWRGEMFRDPATGLSYETPDHQYHWFRIMIALALKVPIPQETIDYLDLPEELNGQILGKKHLLTLILLAPPRHGKTELAIHTIIWLICYRPNVRIMYCSGIKSTSQDNTNLIKNELEYNENLVEKYGPFRDDTVKWNEYQFTVATRDILAKSPTVLPIGRGSNILSKDADLIVIDDPQDLDAAESELTTTRDFRWFTTQLMSRREPHTPVIGLGSHLPTMFGDLWTQIEDNAEALRTGRQVLIIKKIKAHDYNDCDSTEVDEDGKPAHISCVLWHSLRPYWFLEAQRASIGDDVLYEAVYNQELLEGALRFFSKDIVRNEFIYPDLIDWKHGPWPDLDLKVVEPGILDYTRSWRTVPFCCGTKDKLLVALGVDPGASDAKTASESAFLLGGVCKQCHRIYLVDVEHVRQSPELNPHSVIEFASSYPELDRVRIEINAYQKALARDPVLVAAQSKYRFIIESWNTDVRKNDPMIGIPVISRWMKNGKFSMPYQTEHDQEISEYIIRQFIRWPKRPNDIVMAIWLMELSLAQLYDDAKYNVPEYGDEWDNLPAHLKEQVYEVDMADVWE